MPQHLVIAPRTVAYHPALGRWAVVGLTAFPPALGRLAPRRAVGLGRAALDAALGWVTLDAAQVAVAAQALGVVRTHIAAFGWIALDDALGGRKWFALDLTIGRVALGRAHLGACCWLALPSTLRAVATIRRGRSQAVIHGLSRVRVCIVVVGKLDRVHKRFLCRRWAVNGEKVHVHCNTNPDKEDKKEQEDHKTCGERVSWHDRNGEGLKFE